MFGLPIVYWCPSNQTKSPGNVWLTYSISVPVQSDDTGTINHLEMFGLPIVYRCPSNRTTHFLRWYPTPRLLCLNRGLWLDSSGNAGGLKGMSGSCGISPFLAIAIKQRSSLDLNIEKPQLAGSQPLRML